jgi:hypothetical protein
MKPVFQTKRGKGGNCFQAVIASMLELELDEVPDFCNLFTRDDGGWYRECNKWLSKIGIGIIRCTTDEDSDGIIEKNQGYFGHFILDVDDSDNPYCHVVIKMAGKGIVHDPTPGNREYNSRFNHHFIVLDDISKFIDWVVNKKANKKKVT